MFYIYIVCLLSMLNNIGVFMCCRCSVYVWKHVLYYVCKDMTYIHRSNLYDCFFFFLLFVVYCICFFIKHVSNCSHIIMTIMQILCGHHWNHTLFFAERTSKIRNTISRAMFLKSKHLTNKHDRDLTFMFCARVRMQWRMCSCFDSPWIWSAPKFFQVGGGFFIP